MLKFNDGVFYIVFKLGRYWVRCNRRMVSGPFATAQEAVDAV